MLKLCFPDGNEYELKEIGTSLYQIAQDKPHPNFTPINIVAGNPQGFLREYTYPAIIFNSKYYAAKLLNKEQI